MAAAQAGHNVVMSPGSHCYFDHSYADLPTEKVITFDPVPPNLTDDQKKLIIGAQGNLWTEWVPDVPTAEQRILPRMIALSEALWSEKKDDPATFMNRLRPYYARLDAMGCNYYLPKPEAEYDAVLLNGPSEVRFMPSPIADGVIRYTIDGSLPTATSPEARGGVSVDQPCVITAAIFRPGGAVSEPIHVDVAAYKPTDSDNLVGGLTFKVFDGAFDTVPDFDKLKPAASGEGNTIGLVGDRKLNYAIEYNGYIRIDKDGTYTFTTTSDDGSVLWLGNVKVVDSDGPHGAVEKRGRIYLKSGVYPIKIGYFQGGGDQELSATIEGPGLSKQALPPSMLFRNP
jgi:hexosaminidase